VGCELTILGKYFRDFLKQHLRKRWILTLASSAFSLSSGVIVAQIVGAVTAIFVAVGVVALIIFGWPFKEALSNYFHLKSLYFEECENRLRPQRQRPSTGSIADEVTELFNEYTIAPDATRHRQRVVEIPLYPPFAVSKTIAIILAHPCFLRLDRIEQLSFAHHIFEGAKHSRREHVLGVLHLMKEVCDRFQKEKLLDERDLEIAQIAALIHDAFHTPFGHALDGVGRITLKENHETVPPEWKYDRGRLILALQNDNWFGLALTNAGLNADEIKILLRIFRYSPEDQKWLKENGKYLFIATLVQGSGIDLDRIDYVNRDAVHTFGTQDVVDYRRLLVNIETPKDSDWLVLFKEGAADLLRASEVLRYKNFALVYESDENASAEEMISHATYRLYTNKLASTDTLRRFLMLSDFEVEDIIQRHGGTYEKWMSRSAIHEAGSYVTVASYPVNLEDIAIDSKTGNVRPEILGDVLSRRSMNKISDSSGPIDQTKAKPFIHDLSKRLKDLQKEKLDPKGSTEAFMDKVAEERKLSRRCLSIMKKRELALRERKVPYQEDMHPDEPIVFMRGAIEDPWSGDDVKILNVGGRSKTLEEYFGQKMVANPKVYRIRIFAPFEVKDLGDELREAFEDYLLENFKV